MKFNNLILVLIFSVLSQGCETYKTNSIQSSSQNQYIANIGFGYDLNNLKVVDKKIKRGDTFGSILENNGIDYPDVYKILEKTKRQVNTRKLVIGKPYKLLYTKDSVLTPLAIVCALDSVKAVPLIAATVTIPEIPVPVTVSSILMPSTAEDKVTLVLELTAPATVPVLLIAEVRVVKAFGWYSIILTKTSPAANLIDCSLLRILRFIVLIAGSPILASNSIAFLSSSIRLLK